MIRPKNKYKSDIQSAIDETAKYPVKDTDFMTDDEEKNLKLCNRTSLCYNYSNFIKRRINMWVIMNKKNIKDSQNGSVAKF